MKILTNNNNRNATLNFFFVSTNDLHLECHFIIHEHCQSNVPPMCTVNYKKLADALGNEAVDLGAFGLVRMHSAAETESEIVIHPPDDNHSESPSGDFTFLEPPLKHISMFPENERKLLPTFSDFRLDGRIGNGAYAKVYCAQHIQSKQYVAIKVANASDADARQQLEIEREILFRYGGENPYMVKAFCSFHHGNRLFLVMEVVNGGTLYNRISTTQMNEEEIRFYLAEIICALQYLHSKNIVYRDLKLEHAIVSSEGHIRLVDYGLGRFLRTPDEKCFTCCGTLSYMAPEVRQCQTNRRGNGYSFPVDYWALGIMMVQMLVGEQLDFLPSLISNFTKNPDDGSSIVDQLELPAYRSTVAKSFIAGLLEINPEKRLGSPNSPHGPIRDHQFFKWRHQIAWQDVDEGVTKPIDKIPLPITSLSETSVDQSISSLASDRGYLAREEWAEIGRSVCTPAEEHSLRSFDYVNVSTWQHQLI